MKKVILAAMAGLIFIGSQSFADGPGGIGSGEVKISCQLVQENPDGGGSNLTQNFEFERMDCQNCSPEKLSRRFFWGFLATKDHGFSIITSIHGDISLTVYDGKTGLTYDLSSQNQLNLNISSKKKDSLIKISCK